LAAILDLLLGEIYCFYFALMAKPLDGEQSPLNQKVRGLFQPPSIKRPRQKGQGQGQKSFFKTLDYLYKIHPNNINSMAILAFIAGLTFKV
jgi:hypothetical protein